MLSLFRKFFFYVVSLFVGTGILANAARTSPEEAMENWGKWFRFLGIDTAPPWMKSDTFYVAVIVGSAVLVVAGIYGIVRSWLRKRNDGFISMQEACTRTYETFRKHGGNFRAAPDELSTGDALGWCASFLIVSKALPLYGIHPPSRERERIPGGDVGFLNVENDATELHEVMSPRNPIWKDLRVKVEDLEPIIEGIKREYRD